MKTFVSTNTCTVIDFLALWILAVGLGEGLACQEAAHRLFVTVVLDHPPLQQIGQKLRYARVLPRSLDARPPSEILVQRDCYVAKRTLLKGFHDTETV